MKEQFIKIILISIFIVIILCSCSISEKFGDKLELQLENIKDEIDSKISTIMHVKTEYIYEDKVGLQIDQIVKLLITEMLEDLKETDENRSFVIVDYKNIECLFEEKDSKLFDKTWYLSGKVSIRYEGYVNPSGSHTNLPSNEYVVISLGSRIIIKDNQTYTLFEEGYFNNSMQINTSNIRNIGQIQVEYNYSDEKQLSIDEVAELLLSKMMEDMKKQDENRSFIITDYKDLNFSIIDKNSNNNHKWNQLKDNMWHISGKVKVKYEGYINSSDNKTKIPNNGYIVIPLGSHILVKNNQTYTLYEESYYYTITGEDKKNHTVTQVETEYYYDNKEGLHIDNITEQLLTKMLDDLKDYDENRSFIIVDYKDLDFSVYDKSDNGSCLSIVKLKDNMWYIEASASIKFQGRLSPIGCHKDFPENMYFDIPLGSRIITKSNQNYSMYNMNKYYNENK